jgi:hypothetical protein
MQQSSFRNGIIIGIIASLLLAGIPAVMAGDDTNGTVPYGGTITVLSWPPGAAVSLNDEYFNTTPAIFDHVPPGKYLVNVSMAGYNTESIPTAIINGSTREIGVTLENASAAAATVTKKPGFGSIAVDSNPGEASVTVDGTPAGMTPAGRAALILNNIPNGDHVVTVELSGYPSFTSNVTVIKNQVVKVNADFVARTPTIPGTPIATTNPGKPVPLSPLTAIAAAGLIGLAAASRRS